jgi:mono/diheme cytochrome c family protein
MKTLAILVYSLSALFLAMLPGCGPKQLSTPTTAEGGRPLAVEDSSVIARGWYVVNGPAHCVACHTAEGPLTPLDPDNTPSMAGGF